MDLDWTGPFLLNPFHTLLLAALITKMCLSGVVFCPGHKLQVL